MSPRNPKSRRSAGLATLLGLALAVAAAAGCSDRFAVEEGERRPDAVVETFPPAPVCTYVVREIPPVAADAAGRPLADLVRWRDGALLVRVEPGAEDAPTVVAIDRIARSGERSQEGRATETGAPDHRVVGLSAVAGGGRVHVALTREGGRVDLLSLSIDGATEAARTVAVAGESPARLLWLGDGPLIEAGGAVLRPDDGTSDAETPSPAGADGGVEVRDGGGPGPAAPGLPSVVRTVVVAGDGLGWVHGDQTGLWLSHQGPGDEPLRMTRVATDPEARVELLWAGDRYLLADGTITEIGRYVLPRDGGGESGGLSLGGRFVVPRPPVAVAHAAWDSAGPRHVGVAQTLGPRHIRFLDVALVGQLLDAEIHIHPEGDVTSLDVLWDGHGYVLLWGEAREGGAPRATLVRFSCPDDA